ncbi:MAG: hypothetical protein M1155_02375 [Patescibacteria group bacterium]|nr:hypothetical protein [Patescibacteria group bacterium]
MVPGSSPGRGAKKLDTNSFFEDEGVRSPSPATIFLGQRRRGASFQISLFGFMYQIWQNDFKSLRGF